MMTRIVLMLLLWTAAPALAQSVPYRATWEASPASDQVTLYIVTVDGVEVGRPTTPVFNGSTTRGVHTFTVTAVNAWGMGPVTSATVHVGFPGAPGNLRVLPPPPTPPGDVDLSVLVLDDVAAAACAVAPVTIRQPPSQ